VQQDHLRESGQSYDRDHLLAEYLQARRRLVTPQDVGLLHEPPVRRVEGLRREEVARLAGISPDYYLRLEQGRELHPSSAVLEGLARALRLDGDATPHLFRLARPPIAPIPPLDNSITPSVMTMVTAMPSVPLHVVNRYLEVLYANPLAQALSAGFRVGTNLTTMMFNPAVPRDSAWRTSARRAVAYLRASVGPEDEGAEITILLAQLHEMDPVFTTLWNRHDIVQASGYPVTFSHTSVGAIGVRFQTFTLPGTGGHKLGMYLAAPGSPSAEKLELLSLSAQDRTSQPDVRSSARTLRST
jgi:transcriptional regulator with XRE-family HTH domain